MLPIIFLIRSKTPSTGAVVKAFYYVTFLYYITCYRVCQEIFKISM